VNGAADAPEIAALAHVWEQIDQVCGPLTEEQWGLPTDLPGWSVKDNVSHLIGIENMIRGLPPDDTELPDDLPHVKNDIGRFNEVPIEARRHTPGADVLAEWDAVAQIRLGEMRALTSEELDEVVSSILGTMPRRDFLGQRTVDCWAHEQDIRRALGSPAVHEGPGYELTLARMLNALGFTVGKKAGAAEGQSVVVDLGDRRVAVAVTDGRAKTVEIPKAPTTTLTTDPETYLQAVLGRVDPAQAGIEVSGDADLGRRVVSNLTVMV
jgi:uncharacterized protein (TIGR03083 family)